MATHNESQITTDRQTIENWASEADSVPVRHTGRGRHNLALVDESALGTHHEQLSWDEFFSTLKDHDMVVVAHGDHEYEVLERDEALSRATVERSELEEALLEGDVVTSTITETTVIERTVVEEAEIESRVVDREEIESSYESADLISREVADCDVTDHGADRTESVSYDEFEPGAQLTDEFDVDVTVNESWDLTKNVLEQLTIESQIVDTEATETDTIEADEIQSTIDIEGVQQTILESDLIDTDAAASHVIESGTIHTEFGEGDVFETQLREHKTVDEELGITKRFSGTITEGETLTAETVSRETIQSDIVDEEGEPVEMGAAGVAETDEIGATGETERLVPTADDEGKTVVDSTGKEVGMVVEVENETMFVDPHPSLTDKIKTALDWGEPDEDAYPVTASQISAITDDSVELAVENE